MNVLIWSVMVSCSVLAWCGGPSLAQAQSKAERMFTGVVTDANGVETQIQNLVYYWEEQLSETSFVPHELRHLPVKRGAATVKIKFDTIKEIDVKPGADKAAPTLIVTLTNGKTGEFLPAVIGSFRGESDFGQVDVPVSTAGTILVK